jgi:hypothetical protein
MTGTFTIGEGDTSPNLKTRLKKQTEDGVESVTLEAGDSVDFYMADLDDGSVKVDGKSAEVVNASDGVVKYDWDSGDTDVISQFAGEFEVAYSDGSTETFPNDGHITVNVTDTI